MLLYFIFVFGQLHNTWFCTVNRHISISDSIQCRIIYIERKRWVVQVLYRVSLLNTGSSFSLPFICYSTRNNATAARIADHRSPFFSYIVSSEVYISWRLLIRLNGGFVEEEAAVRSWCRAGTRQTKDICARTMNRVRAGRYCLVFIWLGSPRSELHCCLVCAVLSSILLFSDSIRTPERSLSLSFLTGFCPAGRDRCFHKSG